MLDVFNGYIHFVLIAPKQFIWIFILCFKLTTATSQMIYVCTTLDSRNFEPSCLGGARNIVLPLSQQWLRSDTKHPDQLTKINLINQPSTQIVLCPKVSHSPPDTHYVNMQTRYTNQY